MLERTGRNVRPTGPYSQPPAAAHAHASCSMLAKSLRQLTCGRMTTLMSRFGSCCGCENAKCEIEGPWPVLHPPNPDSPISIDITSSPIRPLALHSSPHDDDTLAVLSQASRVYLVLQMRRDLRLHARLRTVDLEPRSNLAYHALDHEWLTFVLPHFGQSPGSIA